MPEELDSAVAQDLVRAAMGFWPLTRGNKVLCTKPQLQDCMFRLAREAYAMGYLSDRKEHSSGVAARPAWMDIRLDDPQDLVRHNVRLRPVVVRSLIGAGYRCFYVGRNTTRLLRMIIRGFQAGRPGASARTE